MTAKELVLVLVVAGSAGGAAALASGLLESPPPATDDASARFLERLDRIENSVAASRDETRKAREATSSLSDRITALEIEQRNAPAGAVPSVPAADGTAADAAVGRARRAARQRVSLGGADAGEFKIAFGEGGAAKLDGDAAIAQILPALEGELAGIGDELKGLSNGFRLRALPEDKRWEQAKTDVGLSDVQVDTLKGAVAERDAAMDEAFQVEEETGDSGGNSLRIHRMDPEKAAAAQSNYRKKVDDTLDETQRKNWREKGYDHAMGKHGGSGGTRSVFIARSIELNADAPKKDPK